MMEIVLVAGVGLVLGLAIAAFLIHVTRPRTPAVDPLAQLADQRIAELGARVQQMGDLLAKAQVQLRDSVNTRLDSVTQNLQTSLDTAKKDTVENLQRLNERLAVIDRAQKNITELSSQVTTLQSVLASKQQRGAFGQGRMEIIIQDGLPKDCYEFQSTLSNNARPDCCILMPDGRRLVIDAKFPLESVTAFRDAKADEERSAAARQLRQDLARHITDIAAKYLIPGETHELALMFVPSESIYAELYDGFDDVFQRAFRARVVIVSPSLLMLAIHVIHQIQKDARMREAADRIHAEVGHMMSDLERLGDRVRKLQSHFNQSSEDVRQILISVEKIEKRGERIRDVEFDDEPAEGNARFVASPVRKIEAGE